MGLFDRLQSVKEKFKSKVEARERLRYNNAVNSNLELKEKVKTLKEREKVFNENKKLEQEAKGLEKKQSNPLMHSIQANIKTKLAQAKKNKPKKKNLLAQAQKNQRQNNNSPYVSSISGGNPFVGSGNSGSPFLSSSKGSNPFTKSVRSDSSRFYLKR
jgi:biopolymer transport protein ExbB/TolQ